MFIYLLFCTTKSIWKLCLFLLNGRILIAQTCSVYVGVMQGNSKKMKAKMHGSWQVIFVLKMGLLWKQARISCLLCVRITDSSHTSFPVTFVPVLISVHLKYPVPCCLSDSWGRRRCFYVGSWSLWWVILLSIYSILFTVYSPIQSIQLHIL